MINNPGLYAGAGVDRLIMNINFGMTRAVSLDTIQQYAEQMMPHFSTPSEHNGSAVSSRILNMRVAGKQTLTSASDGKAVRL